MVSQEFSINICTASREDISNLYRISEGMGNGNKEVDYFEKCLDEQESGNRLLVLSYFGDTLAGYGILNWSPKYALFKKLNIPEIQDLNVLPGFRRRGIATAMIEWCEALAYQKGYEQMGIGVGLHAGYGPAQRLYVSRGYVPDGTGVSYDRQQVSNYEIRPLDDCLCLMMIKSL